MPTSAADLGTGSGAIALALARERPQAHVTAVDISAAALHVARENAQRLDLHNVEFRQADFAAYLGAAPLHDLVISNPPYIPWHDPHLRDLRHEPSLALEAGVDGLVCLRSIAANAGDALRSGGNLLLEHGYDQGPAVRELLAAAGFADIETRRDLSGHERATHGRKR
jgi:release factor glutamine methyltransferase